MVSYFDYKYKLPVVGVLIRPIDFATFAYIFEDYEDGDFNDFYFL